MTRSRKLADIAAAYAAGNPLSFRNKIINGSGIIGQRGTVNVTTTTPAYGTDRMLSGVVAGTGINVNLFKSSFGGSSSGLAHYISGSFTNGTPYWCQRIEAQNCQDLNSQWITVSGLLYHDSGSTINFQPRITKANAVDNFAGGVTAISTGANIAVPTNTVTPFAVRFQLGSSDATNGLMFEIYTAATLTAASKNFCLTDLQLEKGVIQTPFENRFLGVEDFLSRRYYQQSGFGYGAPVNTSLVSLNFSFPVIFRAAPSYALINGSSALIQMAGGNISISSISGQYFSNTSGIGLNCAGTFSIGASYVVSNQNAIGFSAEL